MTTQSTTTGTIRRPMEGLALRAPAVRIAKGHAGAEFLAAYPDYVTTAGLDKLRAAEYPYLDSGGHVYLDYAGAGLAADAQLRTHAGRVRGGCFGNPHSENPASRVSTVLIEQARDAVLRYFNASADEYAVIFTPNATGACRLVGEAYPFWHQPRLVLTADNHNAVHGLREFARMLGATVRYVGFSPADLRVTDTDITAALGRGALQRGESPGRDRRPGRFAYPAQSNFSGVQHPLAWVEQAQAAGWDVLLDAAAFVPTSRLDLGVVKPEFVTLSWYKMFGYPTGIGCLLARRDALARLRRPWFSGGTVWGASVQGGFHRLADDETAFEDGSANFLSISDVTTGLYWISEIGIDLIHRRVGYLTGWLLGCLARLKHGNGAPLVRLYGPEDGEARGGTVAFNFLDPTGALVDERAVARDASAAGISLRTGCFCNPGAWEQAFGLTGQVGRGRRWRALPPPDVPTVDDYLELVGLPIGGAVRVSLGLVSDFRDVERFLDFAERTYRDQERDGHRLPPRLRCLPVGGPCVLRPDLFTEVMFDPAKGAKMPAWFWLNVPAEVLFFLAVSGFRSGWCSSSLRSRYRITGRILAQAPRRATRD
jgi:selenocysteine lyase/cysteine desulfurase